MELDVDILNQYLESNIESFRGLQHIDKFSVGQSNPTYLLTADSGKYVLRKQPSGKLLKSAHAVDREYRVITALHNNGFPAPLTYHLCENIDILGCLFFVMDFADGTLHGDPSLPEIEETSRANYHFAVIDTLAQLHSIDLEQANLTTYGRGTDFFARQIALWIKQYRAAETQLRADMETLIEWLPANMPADTDDICLIHGDYKFDNMLFVHNQPKVLAVLDWELSTLGNPIVDLAYFCMTLRLPAVGITPGLGGIDRSSMGIPEEQILLDRYCTMMQRPMIENWNWYLVFSFFRLASISQGVYKRSIDGNASSSKAVIAGEAAQQLTKMAIELI